MQENESQEEYLEVDEDLGESDGLFEKYKAFFISFLDSKSFWFAVFVLIALISFILGRLSVVIKKEPVRVLKTATIDTKNQNNTDVSTNTASAISSVNIKNNSGEQQTGNIVASKNGTKYYYSWCGGASRISEKNKITFSSIEEARSLGYTPASNCKGLK